MKKYKQKPVIIEALQLTEDNFDEVCDLVGYTPFMKKNPNYGVDENGNTNNSYLGIYIKTPQGEMLTDIGDYIIKGTEGEFYHFPQDIFEETFEEPE